MNIASSTEDYKSCVLKCKNGKHFFRIPNGPNIRRLWLDRLGIKETNSNARVCDKHFSAKMLTKSGKRLTITAVPDQNLPMANGEEGANANIEILIGNILNNQNLVNNEHNQPLKQKTPTGQESPVEINESSSSSSDDSSQFTDTSTSDDDEFPHITELPEFILVFTAFRVKDTFIIPPTEIEPNIGKSEVDSAEEARLQANKYYQKIVTQHLISSNPRRITYIHHNPPNNPPRRERETQADFLIPPVTTEASVQCDLIEEEEETTAKDDSSQLDWINHIIEAHVMNDKGNMYECHVCGEIAASYASKQKHSLIHQESSSLCFHCGLQFTNPAKLKSHEERVHIGNKFEIKKALRCPKFHCTKAFHSKKQLFNHIDQHTKRVTEQRCNKCLRSFSTFFQLHRHKSRRNCWR